MSSANPGSQTHPVNLLPVKGPSRISLVALGMSLGSFISISYILCVLFDLLFPGWAMNAVWAPLFPGFVWLSWPSFLLGLAESFAYGWYVALIFGPLHNFFTARFVGKD